jgi:hypothetical protein
MRVRSRLLFALVPACIVLAGCSDNEKLAATRPVPRSAPEQVLDPRRLPALPRELLAVQRGKSAVLVRLDGSVLARLDGYRVNWVEGLRRGARAVRFDRQARRLILERVHYTGAATKIEKGVDCRPELARHGADRLVSCYAWAGNGRPGTLGLRTPDGRVTQLVPAPRGSLVGHWQSAYVSPDGKQLLLGWSAECESPVAYLAPASGGEPRRITRDPADESVALGWSRNGRALVFLPKGVCGGTAGKPGVYAVGAGMHLTLIAAGSDAYLWRP